MSWGLRLQIVELEAEVKRLQHEVELWKRLSDDYRVALMKAREVKK